MSRANSSATLSSSTSRALSRVLAGPPGETDEHEGRKLSQPQKELLYLTHNHGALRFGEFKLKSGRTSPFFFNAGMFGNGEAMELISKAYATEIVRSGVEFDLLFGSAYKGIPLVACTAMSLNRVYSRPAPFIYDRKEVKDHGEGGNLIGALNELKPKLIPGTTDQYRPPRVLLIDDVLTSGTAIRASMKLLRELQPDVEVAAICVMLDRQERVSEVTAQDVTRASHSLRTWTRRINGFGRACHCGIGAWKLTRPKQNLGFGTQFISRKETTIFSVHCSRRKNAEAAGGNSP